MPIPSTPTDNGAAAAPPPGRRTLEIDTKDACLGMFLTALDRPWLETPFLFQGFVIGSESELDTLRRFCRRAVIDLDLSEPHVVDALRLLGPKSAAPDESPAADRETPAPPADAQPQRGAAEPRQGQTGTGTASVTTRRPASAMSPPVPEETYVARADAPVSRETRDRFRQLLQSSGMAEPAEAESSMTRRALSRLRALLGVDPEQGGLSPVAEVGAPARLPGHLLAALLPGTHPRAYVDAHGADVELPRARQAMTVCEEALSMIQAEARTGRPIEIAPTVAAVDRLVTSMVANPDALFWVARLREESPLGCQQSIKVALYMVGLGRHLGLPQALLAELGLIGMLADVGKAKLPRTLLDKPGQLAPAEYTIAKGHVHLGLELISHKAMLPDVVRAGIAQHHERLDGSGYPDGLYGEEINLHGRIAAIADSFAALSAPRAYANPLAPQDALMGLYQWSGTLYDQFLVEQFVQAIGVFPVGSLVELAGGEVAVVLALDRGYRVEPRLLLLTRPNKRLLPEPVDAERVLAPRAAKSPERRIISGLPSGAYGLRIRDYYAELG